MRTAARAASATNMPRRVSSVFFIEFAGVGLTMDFDL
jgi:hypothetical protein